MNKGDYIQEGIRQLSDTNHYQETQGDLSKEHNDHIRSLIADYETRGYIDKDTVKCLIKQG